MCNSSDFDIKRNAYATESEEIGFNILKGNKYSAVYVDYPYIDDINLYKSYKNKYEKDLNPTLFGLTYILKNDGYNIEENTNLINQLKKNDLISSYVFSIKFNKNEEKGKIFIGGLPHEIEPNHYKEKYFIYDAVPIEIYYHWHYAFKNIVYDREELGWVKDTEFSLDFGFILSTINYKKYLDEKFFENFNYSNSCKEEIIGEYFVKICHENVISHFKTLYFYLSNTYLETNQTNYIEFNYKDLFEKAPGNNDLYYFQIIFANNSYKWIFGRPLFKKYQTVFNQEKKIIGFYTQTGDYEIDNNNQDNKNKLSFTLIIIFILLILLIILGIIFYKNFPFNKRKKKANELDDDFDYEPNSDNNKNIDKNKLLIN